ncbi:hypothetical protein BDC45DRAFT_542547 [Circinella umbellata]|nr:hypothetical protein BDC45DRAFT_542547 [Circinella umbellata]
MNHSTPTSSNYSNDNSQSESLKQYSQPQIWNQERKKVVPELTVQHNGNTLYQVYDPDFIPPLKFTETNELNNEGGLYFDLVNEIVNQKMMQLKLEQNINKARKFLANRIAYRILPLLWKQKDEQERMELIRNYILIYIHDTYLAGDNELHILINQYYNNLLAAGFSHILPSRDVNF